MNQKVVVGIIVVSALIISLAFPIMYAMNKKGKPIPTPTQTTQYNAPAPQADPVTAPPPELAPDAVTPPPATPSPPPKPVEQQPLVWEGTYTPPPKPVPQYQQSGKGKSKGSKNAGPDLTAETLVGTVWQVASPYGPVTVEFGPNGQAVAMHQMVGQIPASWSVQGNKVVAKASAMGQNINIDATIKGQTLEAKGQAIQRVR